MTNELKPCPFCGWNITAFNEDLYRVNISGNDHWVHLRCAHCGATAQGRGNTKEAAEHQAQDHWNTRAERTCHPVEKFSEDSPFPVMVCSECGRPLHYDEYREMDYQPYCGCGAKVVE